MSNVSHWSCGRSDTFDILFVEQKSPDHHVGALQYYFDRSYLWEPIFTKRV